MLAGEQNTGKTTIARYLVGKGPTEARMSTDGIDLYRGLSFVDMDNDDWLSVEQGNCICVQLSSFYKKTDKQTSPTDVFLP